MKYIILIFITFSILAITPKELDGKGVLHYQVIRHGEVKYTCLVTREKGHAILSLYNEDGTLILSRKRGIGSESFDRVEMKSLISQKSPYLITYWQKGAHGKSVEVFHLNKNKKAPLRVINSYLTMDYRGDLDSFSFIYDKTLKSGDLSPIKYRVIFTGNGEIKEQKL